MFIFCWLHSGHLLHHSYKNRQVNLSLKREIHERNERYQLLPVVIEKGNKTDWFSHSCVLKLETYGVFNVKHMSTWNGRNYANQLFVLKTIRIQGQDMFATVHCNRDSDILRLPVESFYGRVLLDRWSKRTKTLCSRLTMSNSGCISVYYNLFVIYTEEISLLD